MNYNVTCPKCDGEGEILHPAWQRYWIWFENFKEKEKYKPSKERQAEWWSNQGFIEKPEQDITCNLCSGIGLI